MTIHFGAPVPLDEITLAHVLEHPIWVWVWEAGREAEADDETWQCPVIGTQDVTPGFTEPVITVRVKDTPLVGSASYSFEADRLEAISLWRDEAWIDLRETGLATPLVLIAVPSIEGVAGVEFTCNELASERAERVR
jgi:hypothetical protein